MLKRVQRSVGAQNGARPLACRGTLPGRGPELKGWRSVCAQKLPGTIPEWSATCRHRRGRYTGVQCFLDDIDEGIDFQGFRDVIVETRFQSLVNIRFPGGGTDGDGGDAFCFFPGFQFFECSQSIHSGKVDIHENEVGPMRARQLDSNLGIGR